MLTLGSGTFIFESSLTLDMKFVFRVVTARVPARLFDNMDDEFLLLLLSFLGVDRLLLDHDISDDAVHLSSRVENINTEDGVSTEFFVLKLSRSPRRGCDVIDVFFLDNPAVVLELQDDEEAVAGKNFGEKDELLLASKDVDQVGRDEEATELFSSLGVLMVLRFCQ